VINVKLPYGISNFKSLRTEDYLYVDKTMYINKLENLSSKYLFFIRPRRFGKSLFLSTLAYYYDVNAESEFEALFGDLHIGRNPTVLKNSYLMLQLNFSGLNTDNKELLEKSFRLRLIDAVMSFMNKYKTLFSEISLLEDRIKTILT
jgi:Predicted AAA-ATPase.